jgi:hypothetical protein
MKKLLVALCLVSSAQAQTVITPRGNYQVQQSGTTTYVTGNSNTAIVTSVPVNVNPVTGIGVVHTPQGSYMVQRSSTGTTTVIQTSGTKK